MDTTVIITVWKRNYLEEQLCALIEQTIKPSKIWVLQNENFFNAEKVIKKFDNRNTFIDLIKTNLNLKFHGRYCLANVVTTEYTWIIDDDVIPGKFWLSNSIESLKRLNCIVCSTGRIVPPNDYQPELCRNGNYKKYFIGDCYNDYKFNYAPTDTYVDYGCNSYLFRTEWTRNFWNIWPVSLELGDDIHLSVTSKLLMNIPTVVIKQHSLDESGNQKKNYGFDTNASWRDHKFLEKREQIFRYFIQNKAWKPLLWG